MIRVLHCLGEMSQGGVENFLMNLYRNIDKNLIQFDFLVNRNGIFDNEIKTLGGKIYYIPALQKVGQIKYTKNLDDFFREHKEYKIIHSHLNHISGLITERAKKANVPIRIAHIHSNRHGNNYLIKLYKIYLGKKIKSNANYKFACSKQAGEFLFGKNSNFDIINNAIDTNIYIYNKEVREKIRKNLNIHNDCFVIGNVARFHPVKNHLFLIEIFKEFIKLEKNAKLLLIGKGKLKSKIIKKIKKYNIDNKVIILEDRKDIYELMQAMDFFVFPSKAEGLGIVLIEAQAAGLKCIASKEVIPEEAKVTDLLEFYGLDENAKNWAKKIYKNRIYERIDTSKEISNKNYDIRKLAKYMQQFYIEQEKKIGEIEQ